MKKAGKPSNEKYRLKVLKDLEIFDTEDEACFDDLTFLASTICDTPIALISLVDSERQWFKSKQGLDATETPRDLAFCAHAIMEDELFYIPDASKDERFFDNPLVTGGPKVAFYAGVPLKIEKGVNIGTLCIIDNKPRELSKEQIKSLNCIARQVEHLLRMRLSLKQGLRDLIDHTLMERTQNAARIGSWSVDLVMEKVIWSKMTYEIHEVDQTIEPSLNEGINYYVEEDRERIAKFVEAGMTNGEGWNERFRIQTAKGNIVWVQSIGFPVYKDGKVIGLEGTFQDIDKMVKTQEKLELAMVESQKALLAKTEFLANMSHEIRTPLNGVVGFTDLILSEKNISNVVKNNALQIKNCSHNLLVIINDILDLSKMDAGKFKLKKTSFNLFSVFEDCLELFKVMAKKKDVEIIYEIKSDAPEFVVGDHQKLRQVLLNLVGNALKFTHDGFVKLEVSHVEDPASNNVSINVDVIDTGIGIPEDSLDTIFNSFEQVDAKNSREYGGTGLGLPICQKLIAMMGGSIKVESIEGKGSTFKFSFCVEKVHDLKVIEGNVDSLNDIELMVNENPRILVVEDNKVNSLLITKFLSKFGYQNVCVASNGQDAINLIKSEKVDLIFMDVQMPVMDGYKATELLRKKYFFKAPIIGLSANAFQEDIDQAMKAGMDDYIEKPINISKLKECLLKYTTPSKVFKEKKSA